MKSLKLIVILILSLAMVLLVLQNTTRIQAHFLWYTVEMPAVVLLFLMGAGGFVLGLLVTLLVRMGGERARTPGAGGSE